MVSSEEAVLQACRKFLEHDETPVELIESLADLKKLKSSLKHPITGVVKDLKVCKKMINKFEQRKKGVDRTKLQKGGSFYDQIFQVDFERTEKTLDETIAAFDSYIAKEKEERLDKKRQQLADLFMQYAGTEILALAKKKRIEDEKKA